MSLFPIIVTNLSEALSQYGSNSFIENVISPINRMHDSYDIPMFIAIDNDDDLLNSRYLKNIGINVVKLSNALPDDKMSVFKIKLAFSLLKNVDYSLFIDAKCHVNDTFFKFTTSLMKYLSHYAVGVVSTFNDDDIRTYNDEPIVSEVQFNEISKDFFTISRRFYSYLEKNNKLDFWSAKNIDTFTARKTSMSFIERIDTLNPRFNV